MKVAEVIPIFKKGDSNNVTNYRPISLLSDFNIIFKNLLHSRLSRYLEKHNLLTNHQYGFRGNSSTSYALCDIHDNLLKSVDQNLLYIFGLIESI